MCAVSWQYFNNFGATLSHSSNNDSHFIYFIFCPRFNIVSEILSITRPAIEFQTTFFIIFLYFFKKRKNEKCFLSTGMLLYSGQS